jgi:sulfatase modifying factor 1
MAGNVSEWTSSAFDEAASSFVHDMAPTLQYTAKASDPEVLKRKVVKGGSWKDVGYFLQNSSRTYEYQDSAKSYIGFRCVTHYLGRDIRDKN